MNNLINFVHRLLKFSVVILDIIMEGTVSQMFYIGPSSHFMLYGSIFGKWALLAIDHIMLALFWSYVPNMK